MRSLKLEKCKVADQLPHPALQLIAARGDLFSRQEQWFPLGCRGEERFGPYYSLIYREDGRQRSIYIGRAGVLVEQVRRCSSPCDSR